ncbi:g9722 [Coccomyxa elongata]
MVVPDDRKRFELELEFINSLANPAYLQWLAQTYGNDASFIDYLQYLEYWRRPQYAKYIIYPHAFHFLNLLQRNEFRTAVASASVREVIENQQFFMWQHFKQNRERSSQAAAPVTKGE